MATTTRGRHIPFTLAPELFGSHDDALGDLFRRDDGSKARGRVVRAPRRLSAASRASFPFTNGRNGPNTSSRRLVPTTRATATLSMPTPAPAPSRAMSDFTLDILCKDAPGVLQVRPNPRVAVALIPTSYTILRTLAERVQRPADT